MFKPGLRAVAWNLRKLALSIAADHGLASIAHMTDAASQYSGEVDSMKYPRIIVTSGVVLLCALSAPVVWGQTRPVAGSAIGIGSYQTASAMQDKESASAMDHEVS